MGKWKYFTDAETAGMKEDICFRLDRARELFGAPLVLTGGFRTPERNAELQNSVSDSAHLTGMAADLRAPVDAYLREKLAWALGRAGFDRVESCPRHFHVDIDDTKPTPCFWEGKDN